MSRDIHGPTRPIVPPDVLSGTGRMDSVDDSGRSDTWYKLLIFEIQTIDMVHPERSQQQTFHVEGDTIFIAEKDGQHPIYMRLGRRGNPFVRVESGMVLKRRFREITFVTKEWPTTVRPQGRVLAYVSYGDFVFPPPKEYGNKNAPMLYTQYAPISPAWLPAIPLAITDPAQWSACYTTGKRGGRLFVQNQDDDEFLKLYWGDLSGSGSATQFFMLAPIGAGLFGGDCSVWIDLDDSVQNKWQGWKVQSLGGTTCKFFSYLSRGECDFYDFNQINYPTDLEDPGKR